MSNDPLAGFKVLLVYVCVVAFIIWLASPK